MDVSKLNKYMSEISTIEPIKNQTNNGHNTNSNKKLNIPKNKNINNTLQ